MTTTDDADLDARTIAQFALAELRRAGEDLARARHQIEALAHAQDLRAVLRAQLLADSAYARAMSKAVQRATQAREDFPTTEDVEVAAAAIWDQHYRSTGWDEAPPIMRDRPREDARATLESMRGRVPTHP